MRCGIVEMHCRPGRMCSLPGMHDFGQLLQSLLAEVAAVELFPWWEPMDEDDASFFERWWCALHLLEAHRVIPIIAGDSSAPQTGTRHRWQCHGSALPIDGQAPAVIIMGSAAAQSLRPEGPNVVRAFQTLSFRSNENMS
jgi:hypothetical protein